MQHPRYPLTAPIRPPSFRPARPPRVHRRTALTASQRAEILAASVPASSPGQGLVSSLSPHLRPRISGPGPALQRGPAPAQPPCVRAITHPSHTLPRPVPHSPAGRHPRQAVWSHVHSHVHPASCSSRLPTTPAPAQGATPAAGRSRPLDIRAPGPRPARLAPLSPFCTTGGPGPDSHLSVERSGPASKCGGAARARARSRSRASATAVLHPPARPPALAPPPSDAAA